jgi:hypothetical protein
MTNINDLLRELVTLTVKCVEPHLSELLLMGRPQDGDFEMAVWRCPFWLLA